MADMTDVLTSSKLASVRALCRDGSARRIRQSADVSLQEVARDVGVSPNAVWQWEMGKRSPHGEAAIAYASVLEGLQGVS
jgi:DNA-binding transcriptional regulator YiaG